MNTMHMRRSLRVVLALLALVGCSQPPTSEPAPQAAPHVASPPPAAQPVRPGPAPGRVTDARESSRVVDLARDERLGGHTIARHVGRTDAQLKARLARERIAAASTYADLESAERIVARALAENERRVQRWIDARGPRSNLAIRYRARDGLPTGRIMRRGDDTSRDATGAVVVLRWRDGDYHVLTSYPENPR